MLPWDQINFYNTDKKLHSLLESHLSNLLFETINGRPVLKIFITYLLYIRDPSPWPGIKSLLCSNDYYKFYSNTLDGLAGPIKFDYHPPGLTWYQKQAVEWSSKNPTMQLLNYGIDPEIVAILYRKFPFRILANWNNVEFLEKYGKKPRALELVKEIYSNRTMIDQLIYSGGIHLIPEGVLPKELIYDK